MSKPINQFFGASETISGDKIVNRFGRIISDTYKHGLFFTGTGVEGRARVNGESHESEDGWEKQTLKRVRYRHGRRN